MIRSHRRRTVLAAATLVATGALLTACQGSGQDAAGGSGASGSAVAASVPASASASASASTAQAASGGVAGTSGGTKSGSGSSTGGSGAAGNAASKTSGSKGVSGSWHGKVAYLAPGKFTVSGQNGVEQAFFTSTSTDIEGAGTICGNAAGQAATPCTEAQLEAAAKKGVSATVVLKSGIAVSVVEDHTSSGGTDQPGTTTASGLHAGPFGYVAAHTFSLVDEETGANITFRTDSSTVVNGAGWICGDEAGSTTPCTEAQLEAAARKGGVRIAVQLKKGLATTIDEEHN